MKNNWLRRTLILVLACVLLASPFLHAPARAYCAHTADEAVAWLNDLVGTKVGSGQCVALITSYYRYLGVSSLTGNACTYATNALPDGWTRIAGATPQKGDIMVWTEGYNNYGHVAICGGSGKYFHQNWNGQYVEILTKSYTSGFTITATGERANYWGVIRPDFSSASETVSVPEPVNNAVANGSYMIKSASNPSYYMNVYAGKDANGTKVVTWTIDKDTDDQHFRFAHQGDGSYFIYAVGLTNRVLDIYYGSDNAVNIGDYLQVWTKGADNNTQIFNVVPVGDNKFAFELDYMNNAVLGITSAANNKKITLQQYTGGDKQHWYICDYNGNILSTCDLGGHRMEDGACTVCGEVILSITTQPESVTVANGASARVSLEAAGDGLTYQWYWAPAGSSDFKLTTAFTGNSYSVVMNDSRNGRQVYCVVTDQYGNSVTSDTVTLNMGNFAAITSLTVKSTAPKGKSASVTVNATGEGLTYEWYFCEAGSSTFKKTGSFTGKTYSVAMSAARDGRRVYCVVTDQYGNSVTSDTVTLHMGNPAAISGVTNKATAPLGERASITVKATGDGLTYEWYFCEAGRSKFTKTDSFTGKTYSVAMSAARDGRRVYCVVTDQYGNSVTTDTITLHMGNPAVITVQPVSITVAAGESARVTVGAAGDGLTYEWYFKDAGSSKFYKTTAFTGDTYQVTMKAARAGRQIYCVVTDQYGNAVQSNIVTLNMAE